MSAPAMKPLGLAVRTTTARGGSAASVCNKATSSTSTWRDSTFVPVPGLSSVSQAMSSASRSIFQAGASWFMRVRPVSVSSRDLEVADERAVIGIAHVRHAEIRDLDAGAHQDEIE